MTKWCVFVIVLFSIPSVQSLFNATRAIPHSHPWLLNLKVRFFRNFFVDWSSYEVRPAFSPDSHVCGASLIRVPYLNDASDIAITAAHCVDGRRKQCWYAPYEFVVRASDHDQTISDGGEVVMQVGQILLHPNHNGTSNDIAILKLIRSLEFSETIKPIELPEEGEEIPPDSQCVLAGWGVTEFYDWKNDGARKPSLWLQQIDVDEIFSTSRTQWPFWWCGFHDPGIEICARNTHGRCPLSGDSGSPLVCHRANQSEWIMFGITSHTIGNHTPNPPTNGIFVKVASYRDWIHEEVEGLRQYWFPWYRIPPVTKHFMTIFGPMVGIELTFLAVLSLTVRFCSKKHETFSFFDSLFDSEK